MTQLIFVLFSFAGAVQASDRTSKSGDVLQETTYFADSCASCSECVVQRGILRDTPASLLDTPLPGTIIRTRLSGLLAEDVANGIPEWVVLLGPYVSGGGHRGVLGEYLRRADRDHRTERRLRWGGETAILWNGRCLVAQRLNETSGTIAKRHELPIGIDYEAMPLDRVARLIGQVLTPWCRRPAAGLVALDPPAVDPFQADRSHLSRALNTLAESFPGNNLRHDLANAQMKLYHHLLEPAKAPPELELQREVRAVASATLAFFEVARRHDPVAWQAVPLSISISVMSRLLDSQKSGTTSMEDLDLVVEVMGTLARFRGILEFRVPKGQLPFLESE